MLTLRRDKGAPLTHDELDDNLEYLEGLGGSGGPAYTDQQARAAQLNQVGSGSTVTFSASRQWPDLSSGTYTLSSAGAVVGACVRFRLLPGATQVTIPAQNFVQAGGQFIAGRVNTYSFYVVSASVIEFVIVPNP